MGAIEGWRIISLRHLAKEAALEPNHSQRLAWRRRGQGPQGPNTRQGVVAWHQPVFLRLGFQVLLGPRLLCEEGPHPTPPTRVPQQRVGLEPSQFTWFGLSWHCHQPGFLGSHYM